MWSVGVNLTSFLKFPLTGWPAHWCTSSRLRPKTTPQGVANIPETQVHSRSTLVSLWRTLPHAAHDLSIRKTAWSQALAPSFSGTHPTSSLHIHCWAAQETEALLRAKSAASDSLLLGRSLENNLLPISRTWLLPGIIDWSSILIQKETSR